MRTSSARVWTRRARRCARTGSSRSASAPTRSSRVRSSPSCGFSTRASPRAWSPGPAPRRSSRSILSAAVLFLPAFLMGATLPALVRALSASADGARRTMPLLYGLNTLGAVAGTLGTGLVFLEIFGVSTTMLLCALVNLLVGAFAFSRSGADGGTAARRAPVRRRPADAGLLRALAGTRPGLFALAALFASGAATMGYEVVFTRRPRPRLRRLVVRVHDRPRRLPRRSRPRRARRGRTRGPEAAAPSGRDRRAGRARAARRSARSRSSRPFHGSFSISSSCPSRASGPRSPPRPRSRRSSSFLSRSSPASPCRSSSTPSHADLASVGRAIGSAYLVNTAGALAGSLATGFLLVPGPRDRGRAPRPPRLHRRDGAPRGGARGRLADAARARGGRGACRRRRSHPSAGRWPAGNLRDVGVLAAPHPLLARRDRDRPRPARTAEFLFLQRRSQQHGRHDPVGHRADALRRRPPGRLGQPDRHGDADPARVRPSRRPPAPRGRLRRRLRLGGDGRRRRPLPGGPPRRRRGARAGRRRRVRPPSAM